MSTFQKCSGVSKPRLTGNQRTKIRMEQASKLGISERDLLLLRHAQMAEWQKEKTHLAKSRCPNCGTSGHSFKFCPFAKDVPFGPDNVIRFRGPNGSWDGEPPLALTPEERRRCSKHFRFLSMPLGPNSKHIHQKSEEEKVRHRQGETE